MWTRSLALLLLSMAIIEASATESRHRVKRLVRHVRGHRAARKGHAEPHSWSLPPLAKLFRASEQTETALEGNLRRLKTSAGELRQQDLDAAGAVYEEYAQALVADEKENKRLQEINSNVEKRLDGLKLRAKAEELRKTQLQQENKQLYKQLEELKASVNNQVKGLEDLLKGGDSQQQTAAADVPVAVAVPSKPAPEVCRCTSTCSDLGWGPWCTVQSATCMVKSDCSAGGAAKSCITVDSKAGPWTRCANILPAPGPAPTLLQLSSSSDDEDSDDDSDSDDDEDEGAEECRCRTPCHDEGWGQWCYVQSLTCKVKGQCTAGGAAGNKCVANDPAGPWTRCANLLSQADAVPQQAAAPAPTATAPQGTSQAASSAAATAPQADVMGRSSKQVEESLSSMMAQVDDIKRQDGQSMTQLKASYEAEKARLRSQHDAILKKKEDLEDEIEKVNAEDKALESEVDRLEDVNRSLHGQLHQLEKFLNKESATLHTSMAVEDKIEKHEERRPQRPLTEALQVEAVDDDAKDASEKDDDSQEDEDDQDDDDSQ